MIKNHPEIKNRTFIGPWDFAILYKYAVLVTPFPKGIYVRRLGKLRAPAEYRTFWKPLKIKYL